MGRHTDNITPELKQKIIELWESGIREVGIMRELQISKKAILKAMMKGGVVK